MLLRDLARLPPEEKRVKLAEMAEQSRGDNSLDDVRAEIADLEAKHGMMTEVMKSRFGTGEVPDDHEFVEWLLLARLVGD